MIGVHHEGIPKREWSERLQREDQCKALSLRDTIAALVRLEGLACE